MTTVARVMAPRAAPPVKSSITTSKSRVGSRTESPTSGISTVAVVCPGPIVSRTPEAGAKSVPPTALSSTVRHANETVPAEPPVLRTVRRAVAADSLTRQRRDVDGGVDLQQRVGIIAL